MTKSARVTIQQWGKSLAVRIPVAVARAARFEVGRVVEVASHDDVVTVKPIRPRQLTLAERLERFDPAVHGGEAMVVEPIGAEIF